VKITAVIPLIILSHGRTARDQGAAPTLTCAANARGGLVRDGGRAGCDIGGGSCRVVATSSAFWRAAGEPPTDNELRLLTDIGTATDTLVIENVQGKLEGTRILELLRIPVAKTNSQ
jgi:hypothetical protein